MAESPNFYQVERDYGVAEALSYDVQTTKPNKQLTGQVAGQRPQTMPHIGQYCIRDSYSSLATLHRVRKR